MRMLSGYDAKDDGQRVYFKFGQQANGNLDVLVGGLGKEPQDVNWLLPIFYSVLRAIFFCTLELRTVR